MVFLLFLNKKKNLKVYKIEKKLLSMKRQIRKNFLFKNRN